MLSQDLICLFFYPHLVPPPSPPRALRQDRQLQSIPVGVWVCVCMPLLTHSIPPQPFLSKLPAWPQSPLCWWEELEEKACGSPAAPRPGRGPLCLRGPGLGFAACHGSVWQLWLTLQSPRCGTPQYNPAFPFTPRKRGGKTITHIFSTPSHTHPHRRPGAPTYGHFLAPLYIYKKIKKFQSFICLQTSGIVNNVQMSFVSTARLLVHWPMEVAVVYLISSDWSVPNVNIITQIFLFLFSQNVINGKKIWALKWS